MTPGVAFALVPLADLKAHERIDARDVGRLARSIRSSGRFSNPIWVARGSWVILNGHHRVAALRRIGAERVAAWVFDYHGPAVLLDRWSPGPPISKDEVERHAREDRPFPPKTTKHIVTVDLPERTTPLTELMPRPSGRSVQARASRPARRPGADASRSG